MHTHNLFSAWLFGMFELISLSVSTFNSILIDGNIVPFLQFFPTFICILAFSEKPNVFRAAMTNLIQIIYWIKIRPDILNVWASICKWCNDNFIEDHNSCTAGALASKMRLTFQYVQFVIMTLPIKRLFNACSRAMLGTSSDDTTDEASHRYCKKDPKTSKKDLSDADHASELPRDGK